MGEWFEVMQCIEGIQIIWDEFHCLDNNLKNFQNDENFIYEVFCSS